jgi:hypothetical protein
VVYTTGSLRMNFSIFHTSQFKANSVNRSSITVNIGKASLSGKAVISELDNYRTEENAALH